jgi:hypothetical protein
MAVIIWLRSDVEMSVLLEAVVVSARTHLS